MNGKLIQTSTGFELKPIAPNKENISKPIMVNKETQMSPNFNSKETTFYNKEYGLGSFKLKLWIWVLIVTLLLIGLIIIILWVAGVFSEKPADICNSYNNSLKNLTEAIKEQKKINFDLNTLQSQIDIIDQQIKAIDNTISIANNIDALKENEVLLESQLSKLNTDLSTADTVLKTASDNLDSNNKLVSDLEKLIIQADLNFKIQTNINNDMKYVNTFFSEAKTCNTKISKNNVILGLDDTKGFYKDLAMRNKEMQDELDKISPLTCDESSTVLNWIIPIIFIIIFAGALYYIIKKDPNSSTDLDTNAQKQSSLTDESTVMSGKETVKSTEVADAQRLATKKSESVPVSLPVVVATAPLKPAVEVARPRETKVPSTIFFDSISVENLVNLKEPPNFTPASSTVSSIESSPIKIIAYK